MGRRGTSLWAVSIAIFALAACSGPEAKNGCVVHADCFEGNICIESTCIADDEFAIVAGYSGHNSSMILGIHRLVRFELVGHNLNECLEIVTITGTHMFCPDEVHVFADNKYVTFRLGTEELFGEDTPVGQRVTIRRGQTGASDIGQSVEAFVEPLMPSEIQVDRAELRYEETLQAGPSSESMIMLVRGSGLSAGKAICVDVDGNLYCRNSESVIQWSDTTAIVELPRRLFEARPVGSEVFTDPQLALLQPIDNTVGETGRVELDAPASPFRTPTVLSASAVSCGADPQAPVLVSVRGQGLDDFGGNCARVGIAPVWAQPTGEIVCQESPSVVSWDDTEVVVELPRTFYEWPPETGLVDGADVDVGFELPHTSSYSDRMPFAIDPNECDTPG